MWLLKTAEDAEAPFTFRILPGNIKTIGRAARADFIVDAALVSRVHCRLTAFPDGGLELRDMDSTNGTFVNGRRVAEVVLSDGDVINIGGNDLVVHQEG